MLNFTQDLFLFYYKNSELGIIVSYNIFDENYKIITNYYEIISKNNNNYNKNCLYMIKYQ